MSPRAHLASESALTAYSLPLLLHSTVPWTAHAKGKTEYWGLRAGEAKDFRGMRTRAWRLSNRQSVASATSFWSRDREHFWSKEVSSSKVVPELNSTLVGDSEEAGK